MRPYQQMLLPLAEYEPFQPDGPLRYFADAQAAYSFWQTAVEKRPASWIGVGLRHSILSPKTPSRIHGAYLELGLTIK